LVSLTTLSPKKKHNINPITSVVYQDFKYQIGPRCRTSWNITFPLFSEKHRSNLKDAGTQSKANSKSERTSVKEIAGRKLKEILMRSRMMNNSLLLAGVLVASFAASGWAQGIRVTVQSISAGTTADSQNQCFICGGDTDDEIYFSVAGASTHEGAISTARISPPGAPDYYYHFARGDSHGPIRVWEGFLGNNDSAYLTIAIREQDNAQLSALLSGVEAAGVGFAYVVTGDPTLRAATLSALKNTATQFATSLNHDGDKVIGVVSLRITNRYEILTTKWEGVQNAVVVSPDATNSTVTINATGAKANYSLTLNVELFTGVPLSNEMTHKCLDVPGLSMDNIPVQEFACNGGPNQRWLRLAPPGANIENINTPVGEHVLVAEHSGKCLDVAGGSTADHAVIQQFTCHGGANQRWSAVPNGKESLENEYSRKCLDSAIPNGVVQQFTCNGGTNQEWREIPIL
jgi:hypothetical protein